MYTFTGLYVYNKGLHSDSEVSDMLGSWEKRRGQIGYFAADEVEGKEGNRAQKRTKRQRKWENAF
jgi:hypothetical protein